MPFQGEERVPFMEPSREKLKKEVLIVGGDLSTNNTGLMESQEKDSEETGNRAVSIMQEKEPSTIQGLVYRVKDELRVDGGQLFLNTRCDNITVRWLVDTGAVVTLLSYRVWESLSQKPPLQVADLQLVGATGANLSTKGTSTIKTNLEGAELWVTVIVADIAVPAIMGMDTLMSWGAVIDTEKGTIGLAVTDPPKTEIEGDISMVASLSQEKGDIKINREEQSGCFTNVEAVTVPPYTQLVVPVKYEGATNSRGAK